MVTAPLLPPSGAVADPTLLPVASGQAAQSGFGYGQGLSAGQSYTDPTTGVVVYRVTDADLERSPIRAHPTYSEGGPCVSLPWGTSGNWYTLFYQTRYASAPFNQWWFVDFNIATGQFTNRRLAPAGAEENTWSFSNHPATPRIGYTSESGSIERYDTEAMVFANTGNFPKRLVSRGSITQVDMNDEWFVTQEYQKLSPTIFWNSRTDRVWSADIGGVQPRIDRSGTWGFPGYDRTEGGSTNSATKRFSLASGVLDEPVVSWQSHPAGVLGYLVSTNPRTAGGQQLQYFDPSVPANVLLGAPGEVVNNSGHFAGQWVYNNRPGTQQWVLFSGWGGAQGAKIENAIVFIPLNYPAESVRLLAHHGSVVGSEYTAQPHATISPDGRLVMWGSNQGGTRIDVFLAIVPAR